MTLEPEVSVCIVSYNSGKYIGLCLNSIAAQTHKARYEIIIVDNGSSDGSVAALRRDYPEVQIIESECNEGFAKASNRAALEAKGEYLLFLNPDTELKNDAIGLTMGSLQGQDRQVAATCHVLYPDGSIGVSRKGELFFDLRSQAFLQFRLQRYFPRSRTYARAMRRADELTPGGDLFFAAGCFLMMRRDFFLEIGLFDERFFLYAEDDDLCLRIRGAGGRILYFPEGEVLHWEQRSSTASSLVLHHHLLSNRYLLIRKHRGLAVALLFRLILLLSSLANAGKNIFRGARKERDEMAKGKNRYTWQWALGFRRRIPS